MWQSPCSQDEAALAHAYASERHSNPTRSCKEALEVARDLYRSVSHLVETKNLLVAHRPGEIGSRDSQKFERLSLDAQPPRAVAPT